MMVDEPLHTIDELPDTIDPEALSRHSPPTGTTTSPAQPQTVTYHIILSQTYHLPVLYISLPPPFTQFLEQIFSLLVPASSAPILKQVGVMGGLSVGNHPITDVPMVFVHPCLTAEGMREVCKGKEGGEVSVEEYLMVWVGLAGSGVGLSIPADIVAGSQY
jgi:ubiquitin-like-conjugating enzyme ATG10